MNNPIKDIYRFNKEAGLLDQPYSDAKECAYPIEEALEGLHTPGHGMTLSYDSPKEMSRAIIRWATSEEYNTEGELITDVERFDKHLDIIVYSFGSLFKLGLTSQQAMKGLSVVMQANMQKLKAGQDDQGKQLKPDDFIGPETQLQKILDERK